MRHTSVDGRGGEAAASQALPRPSSLLPASPLLAILLTAGAYWITGGLGVLLAIPPGFATAVWPPSGIALAATLVWGVRVWPGIVLGSVLVNIPTAFDASTTIALCTSVLRPATIGAGAALQAVVGACLIRRCVGFPHPLDQERAVGAFLVLGGPLSCLINATIGMTTLLVSGLIPWPMAFLSWWTWWVGDSIGVLIVTPLVLIWTAEPRHVWRQRQLSMAVPLIIVFGLATVFFVYAHTRERTRLQFVFERQANPLAQAIQNRLHAYLDLLHALESLYATTPEVTRPAFGIFVQHFLTRYPGLQALSWDRRVLDTDRSAYEAAVQQEGYSDFHITALNAQRQLVQAAQRPEYVAVTYIEPAAGNAPVLGFDVASDAVRRTALQQARDTGMPVATGLLTLVQQHDRPFGVLIFQPIYRYGQPRATVAERRQHLQGYVTAVFWIDDMVEAVLQDYDRTAMVLRIDDLTTPADPHLLYRHLGGESAAIYTAGHDDAGGIRVQWTTTVELAGRRWQLQFTPTLAYLAMQQTWPRWVTLTGGFFFTGLVGAFLLMVTGHVAHVEQLVVERTTELAHTNTALAHEQEALRQQREWLEVTLTSIGDAVIATDTRGRITLLNPAAAALTGWTIHDALERPIDEVFRLIHQPTRQPVESPVARLLRAAHPVALAPQTVLLTRQGGEIAIATSSAPIQDRVGQLQGVVVVCRDISEQRQEELLRAQKIASVGVLAGGIAHDFNNLLTGILGNISLAKTLAGTDARLVPCLSEAEQACQQATALTRQLLTFSTGGAPVRQTVALGDCLRESTIFALRGSNVRADLAIAADLWPVEADVGQLHQVIHNVVRNAAQAMLYGGTVQVRAENMVVHPGGTLPLAEGCYLKITVTDHGGGISADVLPKIFDPYFTTKAHGNGLGLATTYAIVTKHDGYIHAASEVGVGTTFFIYLPASSQAPASEPEPRTVVTAGSGRILVMDDDAVIRKLLAVMLPSLGYEVMCVPDGAAAVEAYHQAQTEGQAFAAVILDITIPGGMGGVDTLHHLRALDPQVKALLSSGYADDPVMASYAQYGFAGVVPKPYAVAQVHDALHRLLGAGQTVPPS